MYKHLALRGIAIPSIVSRDDSERTQNKHDIYIEDADLFGFRWHRYWHFAIGLSVEQQIVVVGTFAAIVRHQLCLILEHGR